MPTLRIPGQPDPLPQPPALGAALPPGLVRPKFSADVQVGRAAVDAAALEDVADDDIVELEFQDGLRLWSRVDDLQADHGLAPARGSDAIVIPGVLPIGGRSRGAGEFAIKALKVFGIDIAESITDFVADKVEGQLAPGPGLYRCTQESADALERAAKLDGDAPALLFLHGTASSTAGSFGGLWEDGAKGRIGSLWSEYGGRVLAYQHRTLTVSPIVNARDLIVQLARILPKGAELHLVSHSRGGLIGELLARSARIGAAAFTRDDINLFDRSRTTDREALEELRDLLAARQYRVQRFVRVACPARGTTLAGGRLDRYFSVLVNLLGLIPGLGQSPVFDGVSSLLAAVLKKRTDPNELPGLEAMMPGSALVLMLNRPDVELDSELHVLGGDLEGAGVWGRLKTLATDLFYLSDHDLVVHTPAMLGGTPRRRGIRYWIDTGPSVTHFEYFRRADTASLLVSALRGEEARFRTLEAAPSTVGPGDYQKRALGPQPVVFVLPGIMGTHLHRKGGRVWMDVLALARGGLRHLDIEAAAVEPGELVGSAYRRLLQFLAGTHEVIPFPYDWRVSVETSAEQLTAAIEKALDYTERRNLPIRIVAHSMGGVVVRAMLASKRGAQAWARLSAHPGSRLILLGTPVGGSHAITAMLLARDALVSRLALLDLRSSYADLLGWIARFDGVLDLLPYAGTLDLFSVETWARLHAHDAPPARGLFSSSVASAKSAGVAWARPEARRLARARAVRDRLNAVPFDPSRTIYVAGAADATPCDVRIDESGPEGRRVAILATTEGDGRVPWATGIPIGVPAYYTDISHGDLADADAHFPAYLELLTTGSTTRLSRQPRVRRGAPGEVFELRVPMPEMVPDQLDLEKAALGGTRRVRTTAPPPRTHVTIVHDDLANARFPVLVGHYEGDAIVSAEGYLDRQLDGRLSELHRMERYAGRFGSAVVVLNEHEHAAVHPGAIIVGLGIVGDLSPGALTTTIAEGLIAYGIERSAVERRKRQERGTAGAPAGGRVAASVSIVLIGSGDGGVTLASSIRAILDAVHRANGRLLRAAPRDREDRPDPGALIAFIDRVEIFELHEDRAIEAAHVLRALAGSEVLRERFELDWQIRRGAGWRRRARFEQPRDWWHRLRIEEQEDGALFFEFVTDAARTRARLRPVQEAIIDEFLTSALATTAADSRLGRTLFEMLVPYELKQGAAERRNLALLLDPGAAAYPWEIMEDPYDRGARPVSVETGMIRQLRITPTREHPLRADRLSAFVLGDPVLSNPDLSRLPGAAAEARAVHARLLQALEDPARVALLVGDDATPRRVLDTLHEQPWRILHFAAHGVFREALGVDGAPVTGLLLDHDAVLTPEEVEAVRYVPDLVFINCCHLGFTRGDAEPPKADVIPFHRLAANLATQFISMGAKAVIAAGWAVDDNAAAHFAEVFYEQMLSGCPFGEAVKKAREETYHRHRHTNTWGAFQCYGDAAFSLVPGAVRRQADPPVSPREVLVALEHISRDAQHANAAERKASRERLDALLKASPSSWLEDAEMQARIALTLGDLGSFEDAIPYFESVLTSERPTASIASLEQLANFKVRAADARLAKDPGSKQARQAFDEAELLLGRLLALGESLERHALLGSLFKRRAMATTGQERRAALQRMRDAYAAGWRWGEQRQIGNAWYPGVNHLAAAIAVQYLREAPPARRGRLGRTDPEATTLAADLARLREQAERFRGNSTDRWELVLYPDCLLLAALFEGKLPARLRQEVEQEYRRARSRGTSARVLASVTDQIRFLSRMLEESAHPAADALRRELRQLIDALD